MAGGGMAGKVADLMTRDPLTVGQEVTLTDAARQMRDAGVGVLIVTRGAEVRGVLTDRDIVVRAVADELDPGTTRIADIVTHDLVAVSPGDDIDTAAEMMRTHSVRRLPVLDGEQLVGVVSLGDLALRRDGGPVLADISSDEPNN
jgi:CBS domain-containing protein